MATRLAAPERSDAIVCIRENIADVVDHFLRYLIAASRTWLPLVTKSYTLTIDHWQAGGHEVAR